MLNNKLKEMKRKEIVVENVFDGVQNSKAYHKNELKELDYGIAYISRTNFHNGLESIVKNDQKFTKNQAHTIVFGAENADFFYQPYEYITGNKMYYIESKELNKYTGLFIQKMLANSIKNCGFGYGKGLTGTRMKNRTILLPMNQDGKPDRSFMEQYMKEVEQKKILPEVMQYFNNKLSLLQIGGEITSLKNKKWDEFFIEDVFTDIQRGKRLKKGDHIIGNMPYISSTANNNGVDGFIGNEKNIRMFSNCLTLANSGSVGATFFQPFSFIASDHVTKLENNSFSKYTYLFIATKIKLLSDKYGFNREINDTRIRREKILLPTTKSGDPDYKYMEDYMKQIEYKQIKKYIENKVK